MNESAKKIREFQLRVMRRLNALSLIDHLALTLLIGGVASAAIVFYIRLRPADLSASKAALAVFGAVALASALRWRLLCARESEAAIRIDRALVLEDRIVSASAIIRSGGPQREMESALIEDAAERVAKARESMVIPFSVPRRHSLALVGVIALILAMMTEQRQIPGAQALAEERADVESAGERLEQVAEEVEKELPPESETARLAKEQAELGRAMRRSRDTRAEALKKINELEGRIRQRHDSLESTRADEIVNLAERRLRSTLAEKPKSARESSTAAQEKSAESEKSQTEQASDIQRVAENTSKPEQKPEEKKGGSPAGNSNRPEETASKSSEETSRKLAAEQSGSKPSEDKTSELSAERKPVDKSSQEAGDKSEGASQNQTQAGEQKDQQGEQKSEGEQGKDSLPTGELSKMAAEQATKALPALSEQLLKKAEQMRAGELTPEDIKKLGQAAEKLAKDLERVAQSKEFQQSLEQLARQVNPEQLEKVARQLMENEKLRRELEATVRMLAENRQIREMVAGIARRFEESRPQGSDEAMNRMKANRAGDGQGKGKGRSTGKLELGAPGEQLKGRGAEKALAGHMQKKPGGEYLFLQSRPGSGAARAPYSSAYPQYRREAERAVERSQVPAHLRSMVRNYFDVINPDAQKKQ